MNRSTIPAAPPLSEEAQEALNLTRDHAVMEHRYPGWHEWVEGFAARAAANPAGPEAEAIAIRDRIALRMAA